MVDHVEYKEETSYIEDSSLRFLKLDGENDAMALSTVHKRQQQVSRKPRIVLSRSAPF